MGLLLQSLHMQHGATIAINAPHVSWLWSSCCVCHGHGCGMSGCGHGLCTHGVGPQLPSMWHVCYSCGLRAMYCGCRCGVLGHSHGLCACSVGPWSPSMWCMCCGHGLCAMCCGCGCGALGHGRGLHAHGMGPWLPLMWCVCHGYSLCAMCCGHVLRSDSTPTFSHTAPSTYTPSYETSNTWDCLTIISDFSNTIPAHTFDILPHLAPELVDLGSLLHSWPYFSHRFTEFHPYCTDRDPTELQLTAQSH